MNRTIAVQAAAANRKEDVSRKISGRADERVEGASTKLLPSGVPGRKRERRNAEAVIERREELQHIGPTYRPYGPKNDPARTKGRCMRIRVGPPRNAEDADRTPQDNDVRFYGKFARQRSLAVYRLIDDADVRTEEHLLRCSNFLTKEGHHAQ